MPFTFHEQVTSQVSPVQKAITLLCALVALICLFAYVREGSFGPLHSLQNSVHALTAPAQSTTVSLDASLDQVGVALEEATASADTLSALRAQNEELIALLAQTEEYRRENERLQKLLMISDLYGIKGATGRVIGRSTDAWNRTVTLSVGSSDGVEAGRTVVGATGVVGQVISVAPHSCVVRLLTDPNSGAAAMIQSTRISGVVRGSLAGLLYLENVDADAEIKLGDIVLTSGLGGSYTKGLLIGTIVRIEGNQGDTTRRIVVSQNEVAQTAEELTVVFSITSEAQVINTSSLESGQDDEKSQSSSSSSATGSARSSSTDNSSTSPGDAVPGASTLGTGRGGTA